MPIAKYLPQPVGAPDPDKNETCELCGQPAFELRPFGPDGESLCETCADKDDKTDARYHAIVPERQRGKTEIHGYETAHTIPAPQRGHGHDEPGPHPHTHTHGDDE
jgi:hypothetical protein